LEDPWLPLLREEERHQQQVPGRGPSRELPKPRPPQHIQEAVIESESVAAALVKDDAEIDLDDL